MKYAVFSVSRDKTNPVNQQEIRPIHISIFFLRLSSYVFTNNVVNSPCIEIK